MRRFLAIYLLILMVMTSEAWADVVLIVRREAEASGNYIRICDIARIEGPREQTDEVAKIVLGRSPDSGRSQEFSRWDIEARLYEMGVRVRVTFTGNDMVKVYSTGNRSRGGSGFERDGSSGFQALAPVYLASDPAPGMSAKTAGAQDAIGWEPSGGAPAAPYKPAPRVYEPRVNPGELVSRMSVGAKTRVGKTIGEFLTKKYERPDIEVESKLLSLDAGIPDDAFEIKVVEAVGGRVPGKAVLRLSVKDGPDAPDREVVAEADTDVYGLALVAARQYNRGDILANRDVMVSKVKMDSGKSYLPPNPKAVAGLEVKRGMRAGEPLTSADAQPGEAVKRGDLVVVFTKGLGYDVRGTGKAHGSGMVGDIITVEDVGSKTKFTARITGRNYVEVVVPADKLNKK